MTVPQNVIFIEWYYSAIYFEDKPQTKCWARIPHHVYLLLLDYEKSIVLKWETRALIDLYGLFGLSSREFIENAKSLVADQLLNREHKQIVIFAKKRTLRSIYAAVTNLEVLPLNCFSGTYYNNASTIKGDSYIITKDNYGKLYYQKMNALFLSSSKSFIKLPR